MIHLYIYFKQENAKKIYIFSVAVFLRYLFCAKHSYGKITTQGGMPLSGSHAYWEKQYPRMFLGTILFKGYHQEMLKYLFPALVFNLLIR
jgi:hypothetical protein